MIQSLALIVLPALTAGSSPLCTISDPVAVYALVTKVELTPDSVDARTVRLHGAFALADGKRGDYYSSPRWGSLLFDLVEGNQDKCRAQWADLARAAGTGEVIGLGFRHKMPDMVVQPPGKETDESVPYPTGYGLRRVRNVDYGPALALRLLPRPVSPTKAVAIPAWSYGGGEKSNMVTLVAENCLSRDEKTKYLFEIERPGGDIVASPLINAGQDQTSWRVWLVAEPGEIVKWRVRVVRDGVERAPVATATFVTAAALR